ncbi:unnamed protein product [Prunus armeniaca]
MVGQRMVDDDDLVMFATLIESSQGRGDSRRRQFDSGGPSQGSSKRGNFNSRSSSYWSYEGF